MAKTPKTCPVLLGRTMMGNVVCAAEVVRRPEDGRDPYCPRCGSKFPRHINMSRFEAPSVRQ